ncbi:hypothetical protein Plhal304r1_c001g0001951 [Plasmopara halstedii]
MSPSRSQTKGPEEDSEGSNIVSGENKAVPLSTTSTSDSDDVIPANLSELLPVSQNNNEGGNNDNVDSDEDSAEDDPEIVTSSSPTTTSSTFSSATENQVTVTTVCGYGLWKRFAQQLQAMQPVKCTWRSVNSTEVGEIDCIDNRRILATGFEYCVTWIDDSDLILLPRDQSIEDGNAYCVKTLETCLPRYSKRELSYQASISRNAKSFIAVADGKGNACLSHAAQMALKLLGHQQESAQLRKIWAKYPQNADNSKVPLNEGVHKQNTAPMRSQRAV